jgi:hypothetical protein
MRHARRAVFATVVLALVLGAGLRDPAWAMFIIGTAAPVERLLKNTEAYVKEHPNDARGFYVFGRIHALAYCLKTDKLRHFAVREEAGGLPRLDRHCPEGRDDSEREKPIPEAKAREHFLAAVRNYRKACALGPREGLYHHSLAYLFEAAKDEAAELGPLLAADSGKAEVPEAKKDWAAWFCELAIAEYWEAYRLSILDDLRIEHMGVDLPVAYEAGDAYLRLVKERGATEAEQDRIAQAEKDMAAFRGKGIAITPVIFSLEKSGGLAELLAPGKTVRFDLDGDGVVEPWPWVKPDTCILVWDPEGTGRVTSGRQLFGSVTWWIFWRDGYHALDALDDNRDGLLSGEELRGLAVWRDANGDGVSDPGEVLPLTALGVTALSVRATGRMEPGASPACADGLRMADGRVLPTYDWVARR